MVNISEPLLFVFLNVAFVFCTAILFTHYLIHYHAFAPLLSQLGGVLFVTMVANTRTMLFPMLDPASLFFTMLIFVSLTRGNIALFVMASVLGVATKEILVISSLLWIMSVFHLSARTLHSRFLTVLPGLAPVLAFVLIRTMLGGSPMEASYGYNLLRGEFPTQYLARLFSPWAAALLCTKVFLAFSFLWFGIINLPRHKFLWRNATYIVLVVLASVMLSSRIARVLGILFPVVIPFFLMFFQRFQVLRKKGGQ